MGGLQGRFIPTYVGHTVDTETDSIHGAVHPHIRGAYLGFGFFGGFLDGSSPHTWGIQFDDTTYQPERRFIPTYVGHTTIKQLTHCTNSVHPHIRGAYLASPYASNSTYGSSPHTWGILRKSLYSCSHVRFIPTYVGHTCNRLGDAPGRPVHPHIRGAYTNLPPPRRQLHGSSPHTWGILTNHFYRTYKPRFIPTYVGHTHTGS